MFISSLTYVGQKITMHSELEIVVVIELVKFLIMHKVSIRIKIH